MSQKPTPAQKKALLVKLAVAGVVVLAGAFVLLRGLDVRGLFNEALELMRSIGPEAFFAAMAILPALGFPLSPFWLSVGPVFAPVLGIPAVIALCGASLAVNLMLSYWLARYAFRPPLAWLVRRLGYELPRVAAADQVSVAIMVRVTPGPPYFIQSYLLGLAEIPFRVFMLISWAFSMAFGILFMFFGDSLAQGKGKVALLAFGGLVALAMGFRFLRKRMAKKPLAGDVQAEPAVSVEKSQ